MDKRTTSRSPQGPGRNSVGMAAYRTAAVTFEMRRDWSLRDIDEARWKQYGISFHAKCGLDTTDIDIRLFEMTKPTRTSHLCQSLTFS